MGSDRRFIPAKIEKSDLSFFSESPGFDMKQSQNVHRKKSPLGLVRRYPISSIVGVWATLLLLGGLSTAALVNVNNSKAAKSTQVPSSVVPSLNSEILPTQYSSTADHQQPGLPWFSFGAIALTSTLGCLLFVQTLRSTGYQPVPRKVSKAKGFTPSAEIDCQDSLASPPQSQSEDSSNAAALVKSVMVVPKQQNHPLDWDEPSLADSLDMRQRRPLSHWL